MSDGKWKFAEQYTQKTSSEKIERGGMILIFCIGMILLVGGLLFSCYPAGSSFKLPFTALCEWHLCHFLNDF